MNASVLIEIGTEELPPVALKRLSQAFGANLEKGFKAEGIAFDTISLFATPRRLAARLSNVAERQPDRLEQRRGPALKAAFDEAGAPTKAALGFARSCGVELEQLGRLETDAGSWLAYEKTVSGATLESALAPLVEQALNQLPIPKRMRWGASEVEFVRPLHWLVLLHGAEVLQGSVLGLDSDRISRGHRFHCNETVLINAADDYETVLSKAYVVADFDQRQEQIRRMASAIVSDGEVVINDALLNEVTALVEWPSAICGSFDADFLALPHEALISAMQKHQKYFPVRDTQGQLRNQFVTISNIESSKPDTVRSGNERVIRPRLADADFFYRKDTATPLAERGPALADMLFEKRLGTLADKTARVTRLATELAPVCAAEASHVARAATLSRCDLLTEMVGEFPDLQGTIGSYYARADGEAEAVATALGEFYQPRFAGDEIPRSATGRTIALADKLDSLVGIFAIGSAPTGDKDPYALRRAALGVLRIVIEADIEIDLSQALNSAACQYSAGTVDDNCVSEVTAFIRERLRGYLADQSYTNGTIAAVLAVAPDNPAEISRRVKAVETFRANPASQALAAANKRISNIIKKLAQAPGTQWQRAHMCEDAEFKLADALTAVSKDADASFEAADYPAYLTTLAALRETVDAFFDDVMVMDENIELRNNRLALLHHIQSLFRRVADIALLGD